MQNQTTPSVCSGRPVLCSHLQLAIPLLIMKCIPLAQHRHPQPGLNHQMLMIWAGALLQSSLNKTYSNQTKRSIHYILLLAKKPDKVDEKYRIDSHLAISPLEKWKTMKLDQRRALSIQKICVCNILAYVYV